MHGHQSEEVILHHDNARSHSSLNGADHQRAGLETFSSTPYSPELAPSDFLLFGLLKAFTRDTKFEIDDEVKNVVNDWLRHQSKDFFAEERQKLVHRWEKVCDSAKRLR